MADKAGRNYVVLDRLANLAEFAGPELFRRASENLKAYAQARSLTDQRQQSQLPLDALWNQAVEAAAQERSLIPTEEVNHDVA